MVYDRKMTENNLASSLSSGTRSKMDKI